MVNDLLTQRKWPIQGKMERHILWSPTHESVRKHVGVMALVDRKSMRSRTVTQSRLVDSYAVGIHHINNTEIINNVYLMFQV